MQIRRFPSVLLVADMAQIEYRLLAHFSGDKTLVQVFADNIDFHAFVASKLFNLPIDKLSKSQRSIGKKFNFAQLYGSGSEHLAIQCGISLTKTVALIDEYAKRFPAVIDFKWKMQRLCSQNGGVRNPFGRFRILPSKLSYRAVNTLIQSTAADLFKVIILRVYKLLINYRSKLLFPVHDELVINWVLSDGNIVSSIIEQMTKFEVQGKPIFKVPIEVGIDICKQNYEEKEELDVMHLAQADLDKMEKEYRDGVRNLQGNIPCSEEEFMGKVPVLK